MPRKNQTVQSGEMNAEEFFTAIELIEQERGIPREYMLEKIRLALISAYKKDTEGAGDNLVLEADPERKAVRMFLRKEVVETVDRPGSEISLEEARQKLPRAALGDMISIEVKPRSFGRIAAQTARQVIIQGMREAERGMIYDAFSSKKHEIISGICTRIDPRNGGISVRITSGSEWTEAFLPPSEQIKGESYAVGDRIKVYVTDIYHATRGPQVTISRTHPGLVRRLFELEVPEIFDGTVEVKAIVRDAGIRTKLAVWSSDHNVDPVGACVGPRGDRVNNVVEELNGEKIDIIPWSEDPLAYAAAALAPATVLQVTPDPSGGGCHVIVPDDQLSLAIGKEGQNARLAARLTGLKIDIQPQSSLRQSHAEPVVPEEQVEQPEGELPVFNLETVEFASPDDASE